MIMIIISIIYTTLFTIHTGLEIDMTVSGILNVLRLLIDVVAIQVVVLYVVLYILKGLSLLWQYLVSGSTLSEFIIRRSRDNR